LRFVLASWPAGGDCGATYRRALEPENGKAAAHMSQNVVHVAFLVALGVQLASRCPNQLENNATQEGSKEALGFEDPEHQRVLAGRTVPPARFFTAGRAGDSFYINIKIAGARSAPNTKYPFKWKEDGHPDLPQLFMQQSCPLMGTNPGAIPFLKWLFLEPLQTT